MEIDQSNFRFLFYTSILTSVVFIPTSLLIYLSINEASLLLSTLTVILLIKRKNYYTPVTLSNNMYVYNVESFMLCVLKKFLLLWTYSFRRKLICFK